MLLFLSKTQGDVALSLPLVAHPRLTQYMRFACCTSLVQIALLENEGLEC